MAFVSVQNKIIKNTYCYKEEYLEEIFEYIKKEEKNNEKIGSSILTRRYMEVYKRCGFQVVDNETYKNFVMIYE